MIGSLYSIVFDTRITGCLMAFFLFLKYEIFKRVKALVIQDNNKRLRQYGGIMDDTS